MKLTVLNGSPKGNYSITMQYVQYIEKRFPELEVHTVNISQQIKKKEQDEAAFNAIIDCVRNSDAVLWAFPVYVFLVPAAYKRFIELIRERKLESAFNGKYTAALSTSIHFYDNTAHAYIHRIADDLNMKYTGFFSAEMNDLLKDEERKAFDFFIGDLLNTVQNRMAVSRKYQPIVHDKFDYKPNEPLRKINLGGKKVLIIVDTNSVDSNIGKMVRQFYNSLKGDIEVVNLRSIKILGGCLGCMKCALDNQCVYGDKDSIKELYNVKMKNADIVIYAGEMVDRFFSSVWKQFMERRFMNTHQPQLVGKQLGILVSGPMGATPNFTEILQADAEMSGANLAGFLSDECADSKELDLQINSFAERIVSMAEQHYIRPQTFFGIGGSKVFRDEIWGKLRFIFQGDHRYYQQHGVYDFPQNNWKSRAFNFIMLPISRIPRVREGMKNSMNQLMLKPFTKFLKEWHN